MASYSSILAPVRRLPIDVLKSVFHEMQILQRQGESGYSARLGLDLSQGPWTLSHVCGAWRDLVLSYPQLWSHIALCLRSNWGVCRSGPATTNRKNRRMLVALEAIILRSDQCPLDIVLYSNVEGHYLDTRVTDKAFAMIVGVSHRWRSLVLHWMSLDLERLKVVRGRIPCLESLTYSALNGVDLPEDIRIVFSDAPCLRKAVIRGRYNLKIFLLPLHITHLAAHIESVSDLEIYQSLVECHLELQPRSGIDSDTSLVFLPNVQRLFVTSLHVLAHLCLPSLNDLTITVVAVYNQQAIQLVNDFLHRSRCDLTRLACLNGGNQILVHESLLSMDTLVCLTMWLNWNDDNIINVLASDRFLRNLQHLRLSGYITPSSQYLLTAVIRCHRRHLRSVKFYCTTPAEMESVNEQLASMQGPGQQFIALLGQTWQDPTCQIRNFSLPV
ncbi:hypothetical protein F5146DRAFT_1041782 [Armillaria mellea]|nr:hypothetical protein F5146DRAFT_1041782 [Armillaria mellea]